MLSLLGSLSFLSTHFRTQPGSLPKPLRSVICHTWRGKNCRDDQKMQWWSDCSVSLLILGHLDSMQVSAGWCEMHTRVSVGPTSWVVSCLVHLSPLPTAGWSVFQSQPLTVFQIRLYFAFFVCVRVSGCQISKLIRRSTDRSCTFFLLSELLAGSLSGQSLWKQVRKQSDWLAVQITTVAVRKPQGEL